MDIYKMNLHDEIVVDTGLYSCVIIRVAGGWVYVTSRNNISTTVFVPYDNEFQNA